MHVHLTFGKQSCLEIDRVPDSCWHVPVDFDSE